MSCVDGALHLCRVGEGRLAVLWTSSSLHCPLDTALFPSQYGRRLQRLARLITIV